MSLAGNEFNPPRACCPKCHHVCDRATVHIGEENAKPEPGNAWSVCFYCATILVIDRNALRLPTLAEWHEVLNDPQFFAELKRTQNQIVVFNHLKRIAFGSPDLNSQRN